MRVTGAGAATSRATKWLWPRTEGQEGGRSQVWPLVFHFVRHGQEKVEEKKVEQEEEEEEDPRMDSFKTFLFALKFKQRMSDVAHSATKLRRSAPAVNSSETILRRDEGAAGGHHCELYEDDR